MVIVLERNIRTDDKENLRNFLESRGFKIKEIRGEEETIFGAVGQLSMDIREVEILPGVKRVIPISKPYKLASREMNKADTVCKVGNIKIGGPRITVIAGPCAVENREQILETAEIVKNSGAVILRGGAYKPRTSPYSFQGLGEEGLAYLKEAGEKTGLPVVTEIVSPEHAEMMRDYVDAYQIGTRNMQNFELLKRVGSQKKAVILKRGLSSTIEEWLMAAEYLLAHGTDQVILCERGIRTFETYTRNSLDISSIPVVKKLSHLPVIVDPSHAVGIRAKVPPVALGAVAAGAHGLIVEVHPNPDKALSDGPQSLFPGEFEKLMRNIEALAPVVEKELTRLPEAVRKDKVPPPTVLASKGITVAFQGEHGAYSETALLRYFQADEVEPVPCQNFRDIFDSVLEGRTRFGIVPIENSLSGSIHENYDNILQYPDLKIAGETVIRIVHCLIGTSEAALDTVKRVYSHPQGLTQSSRFLDSHPDWERVPFYDTAGSIKYISEMGSEENAAIAGMQAAEFYRMKILKEGIETNPQNYTRFLIISREESAAVNKPSKASVVFSTPDKPGALFSCMKSLAVRNINLKKLESRPILGKPWSYMFYLDVEMPEDKKKFEEALEELKKKAVDLRILGIY